MIIQRKVNILYLITCNKINIQTDLFRVFMKSLQTEANINRKQKNDNKKLVNIYLRQTSKFGSKILIQNKITVKKIMKLAHTQFKIPLEKQILFIYSKKYQYCDDIELELQQGCIVHVHDSQQQNFTTLSIFLQQITKQGSISKPVQYTVKSQQKICDFIKNNMEKKQVLMVESGRKLVLEKSFKDNQIFNGSSITFSYNSSQLNHDQFQKDFNKLFQQQQTQQQQKSKKQLQLQMNAKAKQWRRKKLQDKNKIINQQSSSDQIQKITSKPNFKKKKLICLKAVKANPQDNSYIWKRDHSFSQSKFPKKLVKALRTKKKKHIQKCQSSKPENEEMTKNAKIKLKLEIQKLFLSDNLGLKAADENKQKNLHSPQKRQKNEPDSIQLCQQKIQKVY